MTDVASHYRNYWRPYFLGVINSSHYYYDGGMFCCGHVPLAIEEEAKVPKDGALVAKLSIQTAKGVGAISPMTQ